MMSKPIYKAFRAAGVEEALAAEAAESVPLAANTTTHLERRIDNMHAELGMRIADSRELTLNTKNELQKQMSAMNTNLGKRIDDNKDAMLSMRDELQKQMSAMNTNLGMRIDGVSADSRKLTLSVKDELGKRIDDNKDLILNTKDEMQKQMGVMNTNLGKRIDDNKDAMLSMRDELGQRITENSADIKSLKWLMGVTFSVMGIMFSALIVLQLFILKLIM